MSRAISNHLSVLFRVETGPAWRWFWLRPLFLSLVFLCAGFSGPLRGQESEPPTLDPDLAIHQYVYQQWGAEQGLPYSSIWSIAQTRDGYLWLGTHGGLVRFDGVKFTLFNTTNTPEFETNSIFHLLAARDGGLWIGFSPSGLVHLKGGVFTAYSTANGLPDDNIRGLYEDASGVLWVATQNGLARLEDGEISRVPLPSEFAGQWITAVTGNPEGGLWLAIRGKGVFRFEDNEIVSPFAQDLVANTAVNTLEAGADGGLWIGTHSDGLFRYDGNELRQVAIAELDTEIRVNALHEDRSGFLWMATLQAGLLRLDNGALSTFSAEHGLADIRLHTIFEDQEGNLWIGGHSGVLSRFKNAQAVTFSTREGLTDNFVRSIFETPNGSLLVGGAAGVDRLSEGRITNITNRQALGGTNTNAVRMNKDGTLYIGMHGSGLFQLKDGVWKHYTESDGLAGDEIRALYEDKNGDLWIGTTNGFSHFQEGNFTNYVLEDGFNDPRVYQLLEDHDGALWVVGARSLARMEDGIPNVVLKDITLIGVYVDADGIWWLGSRGQGLYRLKQGELTNFTARDGLFDDFVWMIFEDRKQNLWMCSDKGIYRVKKSDLNAFAEGKKPKIDSIGYGIAEGMRSVECNGATQPSGAQTSDGMIWFPSMGGAVRVDPEFPQNRQAPPVLIESLLYKSTSYSPVQALVFEPGVRELEIHYTGLSFVDPRKVQFKYQLVGFDEDWVEAGTRRWAHYGNLPPGNYEFRVMASNNSGLWSESAARVGFRMLPFFYETMWFYALAGLAAGLLLFGGYKWRTQRLRALQLKLEQQVREKTADLREARDLAQEAAEEIRRSEEFLQTLLDASPIAISITRKKDGRYLMANRAAAKTMGVSQDELLKHSSGEIYSNPDDRANVLKQLEETGRVDNFDIHARRFDTGEELWLNLNSRLIEFEGEEALLNSALDFTERKKAEEKIARSEEFLQTLLDTSPVPIYIVSKDEGRFLRANQAAAELNRLTQSELLQRTTKEWYFDPSERKSLLRQIEETGRVDDMDLHARRLGTGEDCWLFFNARLIDYRGQEAILVVSQDITERKESEIENERLRRGLEATGIGTWAADLEAGTVEWDDCSLAIYGISREQFVADLEVWENALHPDDKEKTLKHLGELNEKEATAYDVEYRIVRPSGEVRHVHAEGTFERDDMGKLLYHSGTHRDVTEKRQQEESLKQHSALVDMLRQTVSDANEAADFREGAGVCLKSINAYTGWPIGHVYFLSEEDDDLLVPSRIWHIENKKRFKAIFDVTEKMTFKRGVGLPGRVLKTGEPAWIKDVTVDPNFPRAKMVDDIGIKGAFAFPVWAGAKVVAVLEFFDDEASEPDESLMQTVTHIGSQLGRLYEREQASTSLRAAVDIAEDATRAKDMFLAAMSHEIRTPMNGVVGMIELMQTTPLADDQSRMLGTAKDSAFQLLTIINDILDFSKIEAGKLVIEKIAFDLRKAADAVGEILGVIAAEKGLLLIVHIQPEVPRSVLGDETRIRQILLNLAGNALKFTEIGEVHIGISLGEARADGAAEVIYEVKDSGIGMTEEQVSRLFKPFEQAEASTSRRYGGTGLGLSIVARLTEMMGGKAEVESEPGKGSTFRVILPHDLAKVEAGEPAEVGFGRTRMLVQAAGGCRMDLLAQIVKGEDGGRLESLEPSSKPGDVVAALIEAETAGKPYDLVYLTAELGASGQEELRRTITAEEGLKNQPRFVVERHNTPVAEDGTLSVVVPVTPVLESNLRRALAIVTGRASPSIAKPATVKFKVGGMLSLEEAEAAGTLILVAEDNKTNQDLIGRQLTMLGYAHEIADDGKIALRMLSERSYGLLLSDVHMPNMDGHELTKAIRQEEKGSGTRLPVIAVSANALKGEGERCLEAGMDGFLPKPMGLNDLRECLESWLPENGADSS